MFWPFKDTENSVWQNSGDPSTKPVRLRNGFGFWMSSEYKTLGLNKKNGPTIQKLNTLQQSVQYSGELEFCCFGIPISDKLEFCCFGVQI